MKFLMKEVYSPLFLILFSLSMYQLWTGYPFFGALILGLGAATHILFGVKYNPDKYTKEDLKKAFIAGLNEIRCTEIVLDELSNHCALNSECFDKWDRREKDRESK